MLHALLIYLMWLLWKLRSYFSSSNASFVGFVCLLQHKSSRLCTSRLSSSKRHCPSLKKEYICTLHSIELSTSFAIDVLNRSYCAWHVSPDTCLLRWSVLCRATAGVTWLQLDVCREAEPGEDIKHCTMCTNITITRVTTQGTDSVPGSWGRRASYNTRHIIFTN